MKHSAFPVSALLIMALAVDAAHISETALTRFWDETTGKTIRRLPVQVVPENSFVSLSNVNFENPTPSIELRQVSEVAAKSTYNVFTLTLRSVPDLSDAITQERVKAYIAAAHAAGMQVLMDIDVRIARFEFLRRWPEHHAGMLRVESVAPTNGVARFALDFGEYRDHMAWGARAGYAPLEGALAAAYVVKVDADGLADPTSRRDVRAALADVACASNCVTGSIGGLAADERLVVAAKFKLLTADPCSPHLTPYLEELARRYRALGADGAMRDEWGFPPMRDYAERHTAFHFTDLFAAEYAKRNGGRDYLRDCLLMVQGEKGAEAQRRAAVDAFNRTIYDVIAGTEVAFYDFNKRVFGEDVYVTKHPTWHTRFRATEFLHNGFDWWAAKRDWAQSDESVPLPCITGMTKKFGGPLWMNEGYGPDPEHYPFALWRYALAGGRMVYHGIYGGGGKYLAKYSEAERKIHGQTDILTPQAVRAQARVSLLPLITRAPIDCPVALVFGHARTLNWLDPAFEDGGLKLAYALGKQGWYVDDYPSSELSAGTFTLGEDGYLRVGQQRYVALALHRLSAEDVAAFRRMLGGRACRTRLFAWDSPSLSGAVALAHAEDGAPIAQVLAEAKCPRQTPLTDRGLNKWSDDKLPAPDGVITLTDGTVARIKGCLPNVAGDAISGSLTAGKGEVAYEAEGLFAARFDADGNLEALVAGGLRFASAKNLNTGLIQPGVDVVLMRKNDGRWRGLLQTATPKDGVPAALLKLTDDWRILELPSMLKGE